MLRAVIVEDEMLVKLGMKMCIEQAPLDITVVAALASAEEALHFFEHDTAEILITDIKLTGLSGLDLLERLQPRLPHMLSVVLSCYEDFSYARRAYEIGADTYILKHELKEDALAQMVVDLYHKKFAALQGAGGHAARAPQPEAGNWLNPQRLPPLAQHTCVLSFLWLRSQASDDASYENISFPILCETATETMSARGCGVALLHPRHAKVMLLFLFDLKTPEPERHATMEAVFLELRGKVKTYFNLDCFLYAGQPVHSEEALRESYAELKRTQSWLFYCEAPALVTQFSVPATPLCCECFAVPEPVSFTGQWQQETAERWVQYFAQQQQRLCDPASLRIEIDRYLHMVRQVLQRDFGMTLEDAFAQGKEPSYLDIEQITHAQALLAWTLAVTSTVCDAVNTGRGLNPIVSKIAAYARAHYAEKITLENVADEFHINVTYFCRVFKKQTGENFVAFLNRLRIEQAIVLLNTTDMTVEQIADAVGIKTANYFFRLFKKITGKTVGHYRHR